MWYLHTMGYYCAMKEYEPDAFTGKWMQLEKIIVNEISQTPKFKYQIVFLIWEFQNTHIQIRTVVFKVVSPDSHLPFPGVMSLPHSVGFLPLLKG